MTFSFVGRLDHPLASDIYRHCYCYDDQVAGVYAEPLVAQTTAVVQFLFGSAHPDDVSQFNLYGKHVPQKVRFDFAADLAAVQGNDSDLIVCLDFLESDGDGSTYAVTALSPLALQARADMAVAEHGALKVWLCSHIEDYFPSPPQTFYCSMTDVSNTCD